MGERGGAQGPGPEWKGAGRGRGAGGRKRQTTPARLTATVTATAATNGRQERPATAHQAREIRVSWGHVRPEKRTVVWRHRLTENLAYALRARAPQMPPNHHQQPTMATSSNVRTW